MQEEKFAEKEKAINLDLKIGEMNIEIQNLKMENQDLTFKLNSLQENNNILEDSEIYDDNYEAIAQEFDSQKFLTSYGDKGNEN